MKSFTAASLSLGLCAASTARAEVMLGVTWSNVLYDIDTSTGAATNPRAIAGMPGLAMGITYGATSSDVFVLLTSARLYRVNSVTGAATLVANTGYTGLLFEGDVRYNRADGMLYGLHPQNVSSSHEYLVIDPATGATEVRSIVADDLSLLGDLQGMAFDHNTGTGLILDEWGQSSPGKIHRINLATGALLSTVLLDVNLSGLGSLEFGADGNLYLVDGNDWAGPNCGLRRVDLATGTTTLIGTPAPTDLSGLASIPAPGTLGGLVIAMAVVGPRRRR